MEADFSGWATKALLKCSDGRTIMPDAFKHQDQVTVPLVWQHGHSDVENVLGKVVLENREEGVWAQAFFNNTDKAKHARELVEHGDINQMSIWANGLIEKAKNVVHGVIREVSLVLSGANPGALIQNVNIRHADGSEDELEDEVIIFTGLAIEHSTNTEEVKPVVVHEEKPEDKADTSVSDSAKDKTHQEIYDSLNDDQKQMVHSMLEDALTQGDEIIHADEDPTVAEVYESMTEEQKQVCHFMIGQALAGEDALEQSNLEVTHAAGDGKTVKEVYDSMTDMQKQVLHFMVGEALAAAEDEAKHDNLDDSTNTLNNDDDQKGQTVKHNVFEGDTDTKKKEQHVLSHDAMNALFDEAKKEGSLKAVIEGYALSHGIEDIDVLFPDATAIDAVPEFLQRRTEWVGKFLGAARKSPFSRIKTLNADLTEPEARAKGYIKGTLKKEEFFKVARRVTVPTTVYKKQKLDRDDVVDITDFDVVAWLKAEMRVMLDEEVARAGLIGDGRDISEEDKIDEQCIRPIASDHELYATQIFVNLGDANSSIQEVVDAIVVNRAKYKGTGLPTMFTTETIIARFLLLKDSLGRRIYKNLDELATELRVASVVPVEVMEEEPDLIAILVNPVDYVYGATRGGEVNMFDDFDIDYNQHKYLIETRCSGALTRLKSALVVRRTADNSVLVVPTMPTFDEETGDLTIPTVTGVVYKHGDDVVNAAGSPYTVPSGETWTIIATPATSAYYFATSDDDQWDFEAN